MMNSAQFSDRKGIESGQLDGLRRLQSAMIPGNRFYARKMETVGANLQVENLRQFSADFPFTTKSELSEDQALHPPYGTCLTYPINRYTRFHLTGSTTGSPLRWLDTPESWDWNVSNKARIFDSACVTSEDRVFFPFSFGPFMAFWLGFEAAVRKGCLCFPGGGLSSIARLRMILENDISIVCCTPTYAVRLGEVAIAEGLDLKNSKVRAVIVGGEPGGSAPSIRERIEQAWPVARVFDHHGMTEAGSISYACPKRRDVLHVVESSFIPEVIDPETGEPCITGNTGELVLTNLGRLGSPLLRYRTGDCVKLGTQGQCSCGSFELALEGGIIGRLDDMLVVRGVNLYPSAVDDVIRSFKEVGEHRVEIQSVKGMTQLHLRIEPTDHCENSLVLRERIREAIKAAFALHVPVEIVAPNELPRFEMKAKRWVRL